MAITTAQIITCLKIGEMKWQICKTITCLKVLFLHFNVQDVLDCIVQ